MTLVTRYSALVTDCPNKKRPRPPNVRDESVEVSRGTTLVGRTWQPTSFSPVTPGKRSGLPASFKKRSPVGSGVNFHADNLRGLAVYGPGSLEGAVACTCLRQCLSSLIIELGGWHCQVLSQHGPLKGLKLGSGCLTLIKNHDTLSYVCGKGVS